MPKVKKPTKKPTAGKSTSRRITKDILIGELIEKYPQVSETLLKHGFHCIGCVVSPYESLEAGAAVHNIPLDKLLKDLNKTVQK